MDEIQNCIADAQYGEALRGMDVQRPTERFPVPPTDFDMPAFVKEQGLTRSHALAEPLGLYLFAKVLPEYSAQCRFIRAVLDLEQLVEREERDVLNVIKGPGAELPHKYHPKLTELAAATERVAAKERDGSTDSQSESSKNAAASPFDHLFDDLVVTLSKEMSPGWSKFMLTDQYTQYCNLKWFEATRIGIKSFMVFRDLGRGAFGVVSGARCSATGTLVAIKCMNRRLVKGKKALKLVEAERDILAKLGERPSQFTVWLKYSFTDKTMFYLCLPLCTGGDLGFHLRQDRYFSLARARFYAAEILLGLQHLHGLGVLYRDLKPENILLDNDGHARISDMGLAIYTGGKSMKGRAGTPGYWAPEMIQKQRYGDAVDWWSFGCVLYEFLTGRCPFSKQNTKMERDEATIKWTLTFPKYVGNDDRDVPWPVEATDIITKLLNRDPSKRLGARRHHVNIREHSFFGKLDWDKLQRTELEPPWKPRRDLINAGNQSDIDEKNNDHDFRKLKLLPEDDLANFDFCSKYAHQLDTIEVLKMDEANELEYLDRVHNAGCCTVQ